MSLERGPDDPANDPAYARHTRQCRIVKGGVMLRTLVVSMLVLIIALLIVAAIW
jgi:hypothetical protein